MGDPEEEPVFQSTVQQMSSAFDSALELLTSHVMVRKEQDARESR
jgi:hypothetical protein